MVISSMKNITVNNNSWSQQSFYNEKQKKKPKDFGQSHNETPSKLRFKSLLEITLKISRGPSRDGFQLAFFFASASASYYPEIVSVEETVSFKYTGDYPQKQTHVDIYDKNTTDFKFRLINATNGSNMLGAEINSLLSQIKLVVKINAQKKLLKEYKIQEMVQGMFT